MQDPAQSLIIEYLHPKKDARILALEGGPGWLAVEAARKSPTGEVLSLTRDARQIASAQMLLATVPNATTAHTVIPTSDSWDYVLLIIPKERRYARRLLLTAWEALKPGGQLLLAGPSKGGAKAVIKDANRLFGNAAVVGYRNHQRVAACVRGETLPSPLPKEFQQPGVALKTQHFVEVIRSDDILKLETHPGIFSWETLDEGTALLLDHLDIKPGSSVWDVGCGYGVIGLSAAVAGAALVAMSDVNLIAVNFAQRNMMTNGLGAHNIKIFPADTFTPIPNFPDFRSNYDLIVSNPAFHQGREVNKSMADQLIATAPKFLSPQGRLVLVANRFLNYDKPMRDYFKSVNRIAETNKYHIIEASNR